MTKAYTSILCDMPLPAPSLPTKVLMVQHKVMDPRAVYRITREGALERETPDGWLRTSMTGRMTPFLTWPRDEEFGMAAGVRFVEFRMDLEDGTVTRVKLKKDMR